MNLSHERDLRLYSIRSELGGEWAPNEEQRTLVLTRIYKPLRADFQDAIKTSPHRITRELRAVKEGLEEQRAVNPQLPIVTPPPTYS